MKYLISATEVYRVKTVEDVEKLHEELKLDTHFTLASFSYKTRYQKSKGEIIDEWVSTEEPHIIKYLVEGKEYIMIETQAPNGYQIAEQITFVAKDGTTITMHDKLIPETPKTGDDSNIVLWSGLSISSAMLLGIMMLLKKKEEQEI